MVNVLSFCISTAGYVFTKALREVVKHVRVLGHKLVMHLDDGIGCYSEVCGTTVASYVNQCLMDYGFIISEDKCQWAPSQDVT